MLQLCFILALTAAPEAVQQTNTPEIVLPDVVFGLKEVLEILADYDLRHSDEIRMLGYSGLALHAHKTVLISTHQSMADKIATVIHELLHIRYYQMNIITDDPASERAINRRTNEIYSRLFESR